MGKCWYCGEEIRKRLPRCHDNTETLSYHHFFNYEDIKIRLRRIFGEPKSDQEHLQFQFMLELIKKNIPNFPVHSKCHKEIEDKLK